MPSFAWRTSTTPTPPLGSDPHPLYRQRQLIGDIERTRRDLDNRVICRLRQRLLEFRHGRRRREQRTRTRRAKRGHDNRHQFFRLLGGIRKEERLKPRPD